MAGYEQTYDPDPQEQADDHVRSHLAEVHTAIPGRIESYDAAKCLANVKPLLKRRYSVNNADGNTVEQIEEYPVIQAVPVAFPRGGGYCMAWPLSKGDPCLLVFSERSLDAYLDSDGATVVDPDDARVHDITDAICYPGMTTKANPIANAPTDHLKLGAEDGTAEVRVSNGNEVQVVANVTRIGTTTANNALALAAQTDARLTALETQVTLPHGTGVGPSVPPPFVAGGTPPGGTTASSKVFASG